jgi:type II secretory pathway component PulK
MSSHRCAPRQHRHKIASVLLLVLIVVVLLTLGAMAFFQRMFVEHQAVRTHLRQTQARCLAESGVEYIKATLLQDAEVLRQSGGTYDNANLFKARPVIDDPVAAFRGKFTILAPKIGTDGYYGGIRYGLENESARLNLNTILLADNYQENGAHILLMTLPGMTDSIADAILDWLDPDDTARTSGAEQDYYSSLSPPYKPRNGPLQSIEELLLVRDVTPTLLFGADINRNMLIDANEQSLTNMDGVDNSNGVLNRGWAAYLTIDSAEKNIRSDGSPKINVNMSNLKDLHDQVATALGDEMANFIVAYRQGGPDTSTTAGQPASGITIDYTQPGRVQFKTLLDLIGVKTKISKPAQQQGQGQSQGGQGQIPQGRGGPAPAVQAAGAPGQGGQGGGSQASSTTVVSAAFASDTASMRDYLPKLFDNLAVNAAPSIPGRIDVNQAPKPILAGIPGLTADGVERIISTRDLDVTSDRPDRAYETWLLTEGIVDLPTMKKLMPLVTGGGSVYRAQVVGYYEDEGPGYRIEAVVDGTKTPPVVRRRRDLLEQGTGYSLDVLGGQADDAK